MLPWVAHLYTGLGVVAALAATLAVVRGDYREAFLWLGLQIFIDATDGVLARALRVKERLPHFDGGKLDDLIDYLTYVFIPVLLALHAGLLPPRSVSGSARSSFWPAATASASRRRRCERPTISSPAFRHTGTSWSCYLFLLQLSPVTSAAVLIGFADPRVRAAALRLSVENGNAAALSPMGWASLWALTLAWLVWQLPDSPRRDHADHARCIRCYYFALSLWLDRQSRARPHGLAPLRHPARQPLSPLVIIFLTVFIDLLGFGIIVPLLPFYAESYGASAFTVGLLGTVFSLMQFIVAPLCGRWSDRVGRRPVILYGLLASAVAYVALALADSLALIFAARILGGIAGGNIPTAQAYIADVTTPENRAKGMGLVGAAFGLGFIFGPAIGGILDAVRTLDADVVRRGAVLRQLSRGAGSPSRIEARFAGSADAGPSRPRTSRAPPSRAAPAACSCSSSSRPRSRDSRRRSRSSPSGASASPRRRSATSSRSSASCWRRSTDWSSAASYRSSASAGSSPRRSASSVSACCWCPRPTACRSCFAVCGTIAIGMGFNNPALTSAISRLSDPGEQGGMLGLAQSLAALGRIAGPAWGGFLFDRLGSTMPYVSAASIMFCALLLAIAGVRRSHLAYDIDERAGSEPQR